jgi:hypothetical protein
MVTHRGPGHGLRTSSPRRQALKPRLVAGMANRASDYHFTPNSLRVGAFVCRGLLASLQQRDRCITSDSRRKDRRAFRRWRPRRAATSGEPNSVTCEQEQRPERGVLLLHWAADGPTISPTYHGWHSVESFLQESLQLVFLVVRVDVLIGIRHGDQVQHTHPSGG